MFRRIVAMTLLVSFVAMMTSGMMMFFIERPSFTIQMHPVHKLFGLLMVISGLSHFVLNWRSIKAHLKFRSGRIAIVVLSALLVAGYGVVVNNQLPEDLSRTMDEAAAAAEGHD